ncbi:MAG TPA: hypothetical protein VFW96_17510 [Thermomicrobiales bacterium]|nr:hypothetical protein [Thermomicrobiales bacterium]
MPAAGEDALAGARAALAAQLARCAALLDGARGDDELLALRDLLLDHQFESRALLTAIEERLGAFAGDDSPRALAAHAEALIETVEELQDGWDGRVNLLLEAGFAGDDAAGFLRAALGTAQGRDALAEFFAGLPADIDQTATLLDYAKRYLLALLDAPQRRR